MKEQIDKWLELTKEYFGIQDFKNECRDHRYTHARAVAMYLLYTHVKMTYKDVGEIFGKQYSTVLHAVRRAQTVHSEDVRKVEDMARKANQEEMLL